MATELGARIEDAGNSPSDVSWSRRIDGLAALGVGGLSTALALFFLRLWVVPLSVPLSYSGDSTSLLMVFRGLAEGNWYYTNPRLGAPFGQEMYDYPIGDQLQLVGYKVLDWLTGGSPGLMMNLGALLGFFAVGAVGFLVLRGLGVGRPWAVGLGTLYSLLPYHFVRVDGHLLLAMYVAAPLAVGLIVRQVRGDPAFLRSGSGGRRWSLSVKDRDVRTVLLTVVVIGTTGIYYAIFAGLLLFVTGLFAYSATKDRPRFISTIAVAGAIGVVLAGVLVPSIVYQAANGPNEQAVNRSYGDVERYALKPVQLVLPIANHRVETLAKPMQRALEGTQASEGGQNLGMLGGIGLIALVWAGLAALLAKEREVAGDLRFLSGLTIGTILAATVAGFGAILGIVGFTQIRAWNRITVFVAFFVFVAIGLWATRRFATAKPRWVWLVVALIVVFGALDQTGPVPDALAEWREVAWESDAAFVSAMEATLGEGAAVFQLPVIPFPESPAPVDMRDYDLLKGYLHSDTLTWSYGGMRGRVPDWQGPLVAAGTDRFITGIVAAGFDGLYIDRFGYVDRAAGLETEIKEFIGSGPVASLDGRLAYFDLRDTAAALGAYLGPDTLARLRSAVLMDDVAVSVSFGQGFSGAETDGTSSWHWAGPVGELSLVNDGDAAVTVSLVMEVRTGAVEGAIVRIGGPFGEARVVAGTDTGSFETEFLLPPGTTVLSFSTDAPRVDAPGDPRDLRFQVRDVLVVQEEWTSVEGWAP